MRYAELSTDEAAVEPIASAGDELVKGPLLPLFPADMVHGMPAAIIWETTVSSGSISVSMVRMDKLLDRGRHTLTPAT